MQNQSDQIKMLNQIKHKIAESNEEDLMDIAQMKAIVSATREQLEAKALLNSLSLSFISCCSGIVYSTVDENDAVIWVRSISFFVLKWAKGKGKCHCIPCIEETAGGFLLWCLNTNTREGEERKDKTGNRIESCRERERKYRGVSVESLVFSSCCTVHHHHHAHKVARLSALFFLPVVYCISNS